MFSIGQSRGFWHSILVITLLLVVTGCRRGVAPELPEAVQTSDAEADGAPTFPPTFTPPPSTTPILSPTATLTTTPTVTLTLTPTIQPIPSDTLTVTPTVTATWTPDLNTSTPGGPGNVTTTGTVTNGDTTVNINPPSPGCLGAISNTNLLSNPGFEGGQREQGQPSIRVPDDWTGFSRPQGTPIDYDPENGDGYRTPDMQVITDSPPFDDPLRIRTDEKAFYLSGSNKVFDGGVWQQVTVPDNALLCLTGFAHAWSNHKNDDRTQSLLETDDDKINANFQLGISLTGGTDAFDPNIVWGNVAHLYDTYQAIPAIQGRAESTTITVFVRGYTMWRFDHNDLFFDDISLLQLSN